MGKGKRRGGKEKRKQSKEWNNPAVDGSKSIVTPLYTDTENINYPQTDCVFSVDFVIISTLSHRLDQSWLSKVSGNQHYPQF